MTKADAIIVSAGRGHRLKEASKKQFLPLAGKPILAHTLDRFETSPLIRSIVLVVGEEDLDYCSKEIVEQYRFQKITQIIPGGKERQDSVRNGLQALARDTEIVVIHDGVRPFVTREMVEESIRGAKRLGAVVLAMPVTDTVKTANTDGIVLKTLDRESLWQIQTPQAFQAEMIREAYRRATEDGFVGTDDASLVERLGTRVHILPGSYSNIKITTREDLLWARLLLREASSSELDLDQDKPLGKNH
jgi:2-C-methyl-D-erythritol 4-phosphate cytidylyltransferase